MSSWEMKHMLSVWSRRRCVPDDCAVGALGVVILLIL